MLHISIIPNFARVFEKRYHSCHCEPFVPQDKFREAVLYPRLSLAKFGILVKIQKT